MAPLNGVSVVDFATLLPGPMATLILAEAGAEVIKVERPDGGDDMRAYEPLVDGVSVNFMMLNRGKTSLALNLKDQRDKDRLRPILERADVIIEQFRPGVMARLGLGYDDVRKINPDIIYCSISGWGATGPKAQEAAHDLNFMAETGVLGLTTGADGAPVLPPILAGDIAGGTYPAVINILLALRQRELTQDGAWLDISMGDNLFPFMYWALGNANALGQWPRSSAETVTGGSPRYQIYRTKDERYLAAAPLEQKFWSNFCEIIGLPDHLRDDSSDPSSTKAKVAELIAGQTSKYWQEVFSGQDVCCSIVLSLQEALEDPHWSARGLFDAKLRIDQTLVPALPTIVAPALRSLDVKPEAPSLGSFDPVEAE